MIQFSNVDGKRLFEIPDGGCIKVTYPGGRESVMECSYEDSCHAVIGGLMYHTCEFALSMERAKATFEAAV